MAVAYQTFPVNRTTPLDLPSLVTQLRSTVAPDVGAQPPLNGTIKLKKDGAWTAQQIAAAQIAIDTVTETTPTLRFQRTSREKDMLATCALVVRSRDIAAWNAMTALQKKNAVQAEADVWVNIREFIEANL